MWCDILPRSRKLIYNYKLKIHTCYCQTFSDGRCLKVALNLELRDSVTFYLYCPLSYSRLLDRPTVTPLFLSLSDRRWELTQYLHGASVQLSLSPVWVMDRRPRVLLTEENRHLRQLNCVECASSEIKTHHYMPLLYLTYIWIHFACRSIFYYHIKHWKRMTSPSNVLS